ncbi:MAG: hypothetical protein P8M80_06015 [Pirellulaceae bacterium]|nr:hypothetical protein [Pirellulaceae bacterium]
MIILIGIIVLFIALIVFIVLSAKKTHWLNLVGLFLVFCLAIFYMITSGLVYKTNAAWKKVLQNNEKKLEAQTKQLQIALVGSGSEVEFSPESLKGAEIEAEKLVFGRGRVWRESTPQAFVPGANPSDLTTGSLTVNLPPNASSFLTAKQPRDTLEQWDVDPDAKTDTSLVYVFLEKPDGMGGYQIANYIGIFAAKEPSEDNTTVKLSPSMILPDPTNLAELRATDPTFKTARELLTTGIDGNTRWAMYDILPTDSYDVFREAIRAEKDYAADLEIPLDELRSELTTKYMPIDSLRLRNNEVKYDRIIDSIVYTNQPEIEFKDDTDFTPTDEETWFEIEFTDKAKGAFKVDFDSSLGGDAQKEIALEGQAFDRDGLAQVSALKLGEDVTFEKDQTVMLDSKSWLENPVAFIEEMKDAGTVVEKQVIFRRTLNDFDFEFRDLVSQIVQLTKDRNHAQAKYTQLQEIDAGYEAQKKYRSDVRDKLNQDVTNFKGDKESVDGYYQKLVAKLKAEQSEIDTLYRICKENLAKKEAMEAKFREIIEEKTRQAAAAAGDAP